MKRFYSLILFILPILSFAQSSFTQQSATLYNGFGDFTDRYGALKVDNNGDIVAVGYTQKIGQKRDILVCKIAAASGTVLWSYTYNGIGDSDDEAQSLTIDAQNNIYFTGYVDDDLGNDVFTAKISASGVEQWHKTYNYIGGNQDDAGVSVVLDKANNVIVGGYSNSSSLDTTLNDYILIKYDNAGTELWNKRFNGAANGSDKAVKVVADASNGIFITGTSSNGNDDDYATLKYDANGNLLWTKTIDRGKNDRAVDMVIDGTGDIYVTGRSKALTYDYYTIKYSSTGNALWNHAFNNANDDRPLAMTVDGSGNVFITGQSIQGTQLYNYATIKISATGVTAWSNAIYSGAANLDDVPAAIGLDAAGNVFVTGYAGLTATSKNIITVKYDASGVQQWIATYDNNAATNKNCDANALVVGANGNVYVAGYGEGANMQRNALVINYNTSGAEVWTSLWNGQGDNSDNIRAMVGDGQGNLYLAGYTTYRAMDRNTLLVKTNANGDTLWTRTLDGTSHSTDEWAAVAIDPNGNIIVAGFMKYSGDSYDIQLAKYKPTGDTLWTRHYNGPQHKNDKGYDMKLDAAGNVYITGRSDNGITPTVNYDFLTVKYDNAGVFQWAKSYSSAGNWEDKGEKICVSSVGDVYVVGRVMLSATNEDIFVIKYDTNGNQQWTKSKVGSGGGQDKANAAVWWNNNLYVAGAVTNTNVDMMTLKYDVSGTELWAKTYTTANDDEALALTLDANGNIIIAGYSASIATGLGDVAVVKYDNAGNQLWAKTYNGTASLDDKADAITTDGTENIIIAAHSDLGTSSNSNADYMLLAYDGYGNLLTTQTYNGTGDSTDVPTTMLYNAGQVYVVGGSYGGASQRDIALVRYSASLTGLDADLVANNLAVFPNPCTETLHFLLNTPTQTPLIVRIFDLLGNELASTNLSSMQEQIIDMKHFTSGMYIYQVENESKLIVAGKIAKQ